MNSPRRRPSLNDLAPAWWKALLLIPLPAAVFVLGFGLLLSAAPWAVCAFAGLMLLLLLAVVPGYFVFAMIALVRAAAPDAAPATRLRRVFLALCLCTGLALLWPASSLERSFSIRSRQYFLRPIPRRAAPIISALERYRQDTGKYPPSLQPLVPRYLESIPTPGIRSPREFTYKRSDNSNDWRILTAESNPAYELSVRFGMLDAFRTLRYWPTDNYPDRIGGHPVLAHIDGWVYVDD